jgi:hypothetical protein
MNPEKKGNGIMAALQNPVEGKVMTPNFFTRRLKIAAEGYVKVLRDVVKPWMDGVAAGRHYVLQ